MKTHKRFSVRTSKHDWFGSGSRDPPSAENDQSSIGSTIASDVKSRMDSLVQSLLCGTERTYWLIWRGSLLCAVKATQRSSRQWLGRADGIAYLQDVCTGPAICESHFPNEFKLRPSVLSAYLLRTHLRCHPPHLRVSTFSSLGWKAAMTGRG